MSRQVAAALEDPAGDWEGKFDPSAVPDIPMPTRLRPCCAFGDDMKVRLGALPIPAYQKANITSIEGLGRHGFNNGALSFDGEPERGVMVLEKNGLLYTCRGGFIDLAHVRDYADLTMFLAMRLIRSLPQETAIELFPEGTKRRVTVKLPKGTLNRHGRWNTAIALAQWIAYQMSLWHEVITWYGYQNIKGFSEKVSSFTPEDLYSNLLGIRLAGGIIRNQGPRSRNDYDRAMDAWMAEALRRLGPVSAEQGRLAMKALDGLWWDSSKAVNEWRMVIRRNLETKPPLSAWIVGDSLPEGLLDPALRKRCEDVPDPLPLNLPERIGKRRIAEHVSLEFVFDEWLPERFAFSLSKGKVVTLADFPAILDDIRREAEEAFGPGFDRPEVRKPEAPKQSQGSAAPDRDHLIIESAPRMYLARWLLGSRSRQRW